MDITDEVQKFLEGIDGIVEATQFEEVTLWETYHKPIYWESVMGGYLVSVGILAESPICISISKSKIENKTILFWHATSQVVDYKQIDEWFEKHLFGIPKTDASNFWNIL